MISLFVAALFFANASISIAAIATLSPLEYNATIAQNTVVRFHCIIQGGMLRWDTNGDPTDTTQVLERGINTTAPLQLANGSYTSTLTITATLENNNAEIQCRALVLGGTSAISEIALFRVQGRLNAPQNIQSQSFNNSHNIISWQPPNTLDITDEHPDILHHTLCTTVRHAGTSCKNVSEASFVILKLSQFVSVSVSSWNVVGQGDNATIQLPPCDDSGGSSH